MKLDQIESFDWSKGDGLLPAVVQDAEQRQSAHARLHGSRRPA